MILTETTEQDIDALVALVKGEKMDRLSTLIHKKNDRRRKR